MLRAAYLCLRRTVFLCRFLDGQHVLLLLDLRSSRSSLKLFLQGSILLLKIRKLLFDCFKPRKSSLMRRSGGGGGRCGGGGGKCRGLVFYGLEGRERVIEVRLQRRRSVSACLGTCGLKENISLRAL